MRISFIQIGFGLLFLFACSNNSQKRKFSGEIKTVEKSIQLFVDNDAAGTKALIGVDLYIIGLNDELLAFRINKMHDYLNEKNFLDNKDFEFKEYPSSDALLVDITVIFKKSEKEKISLIVTFAKYIPKGEILDFKILD